MTTPYTLETCGSLLSIEVRSTHDPLPAIEECFSYVRAFDQKYSRFIPGNRLSQINSTSGPHLLDDESYALLQFSLTLAEKTWWAFDPTIIAALERYGYDSNYSFTQRGAKPMWYKHVTLWDHTITLHDGVQIEFGAIGKWYVLDVLAYILLEHGIEHYIIDFGGDIIARGWYDVGLENPFNLEQLIGTITIDGFAIAASNGKKRTFGEFHHLLDAHTGKPVNDIASVYIAAPTWLLADAFSTAVFVSGAEKGKALLADSLDVTGLIVFADGSYWIKEGYVGKVFGETKWIL
jgi:FAD:protein FMN transferase